MKAPEILTRSAEIMAERAKQYDSPQGERSMGKAVAAFNAVTGQSLSEANGWLLMALLKMVRENTTDKPHEDSLHDLVAYGALYGEARLASMNQPGSDWIEWGGGECPVELDVIVEYKLRSDCRHTRVARYLSWFHDEYMADIIAYRIVK